MTSLVPSVRPTDLDLDDLQARASALEATLHDQRAALARCRADLESFRIRYRQQVGLRHEELDELELKIAEAELGELSKRLAEADGRPTDNPAPPPPESAPRFTTEAVRTLFRDVAKSIHPDLARDDAARARRHALMIEANRAYALGDEERLRGILAAWRQSPEAVIGEDAAAMRLRLERRIAEAEAQISALGLEREALERTSLWQLKAMVDEAAAQGKDLVGDMVRRLTRDIVAARNRLDAMTWQPPG